jgi:hypothetical protein
MKCDKRKGTCIFTDHDNYWLFKENFNTYINEKCTGNCRQAEKKEWIEKFKYDKENLEFLLVKLKQEKNEYNSTLLNGKIEYCKYSGKSSIDAILLAQKQHYKTFITDKVNWETQKNNSKIYTCMQDKVEKCPFVTLIK